MMASGSTSKTPTVLKHYDVPSEVPNGYFEISVNIAPKNHWIMQGYYKLVEALTCSKYTGT